MFDIIVSFVFFLFRLFGQNELLTALIPKLRRIAKRLTLLVNEIAAEQLLSLCIQVGVVFFCVLHVGAFCLCVCAFLRVCVCVTNSGQKVWLMARLSQFVCLYFVLSIQKRTVGFLVLLFSQESEYINQTLQWHSALCNEKPFPTPDPLLPLLNIESAATDAANAAAVAAASGVSQPAAAAPVAASAASNHESKEADILGLNSPSISVSASLSSTSSSSSREHEVKAQAADEDPFASLAARDSVIQT